MENKKRHLNEGAHWSASEPKGDRIVITGYGALQNRVLMAKIDRNTGKLSLDEAFREEGATQPGIKLDRQQWTHGGRGATIPHGAVFSNP